MIRFSLSLVAALSVALFSVRAQACDGAAFGTCGVQQQQFYGQQAFAAPAYAQAQVFAAPAVTYQVPVQQQVVVQRQFVPVQKQVFAQQYAVAAPVVVKAPVVRQPILRGRLFGGRSVARSRSVVRGGAGVAAQSQAGF